MSERYPGGIITKSPATPTGPYQSGAAPGVWTLDQQLQYQQQGVWPTAGLLPNFIEDVFSTYLYTGNGSTQTITNGIDLSTKGGLVWIKDRDSGAKGHALFDTARGVNKKLQSQSTNGEFSGANQLTAFNVNGFDLGSAGDPNGSGTTYASWTFRKQAKFFDVVTYTGNGTAGLTVSHSLGSAPGFIVVKRTDAAGAWTCFHTSLGGTKAMFLNATNAVQTNIRYWNDTAPTSSVFTLGFDTDVNASGGTYVAYLFAHNAGGFGASGSDNVISCGSYTGNGSSSGPTITLGYEPQWLLVKDTTDSVQDWVIQDVMRGMTVTAGEGVYLRANSSVADAANSYFTPLATGFQVNQSSGQANASGRVYIYIAIRRGPMRTPTSGTSVYEPVSFTGNNATNTTRGSTVTTDLAIISATNAGSPQATYNQGFYDRLRGEDRSVTSSNTNAEVTGWANTYFNLDQQIGWSNGSNTDYLNNSAITYVTYNLRRAPGFFDEVCYTGTGSATTFSHNLGAVPELMIAKQRNGTNGWYIYDATNGATKYLVLNTTAASATLSTIWNNTAPTSSVFSVGTSGATNGSGNTYVAYLFATVAGVSKVGSYTGTGTTLQVNCGFTGGARFVLIKRTDSTGDWYVWDSARGIVAGNDPYLLLNSDVAEVTNTDYVDTYSAGFEISSTAPAAINANGGTFIFLAIA